MAQFYDKLPVKRYKKTLEFLEPTLKAPLRILDFGIDNPFAQILRDKGFDVINTGGEDLDLNRSSITDNQYDVATAFEILEHMVNPFEAMRAVKCDRMFVSVPLDLWFSPAYNNLARGPWARHYHEFEEWQFDWLCEKAGWEIVRKAKWSSSSSWLGIRPILRKFYPRYYATELRRIKK